MKRVVGESSCFILQEPALRFLGVVMKYGPWRDAMVNAWKEVAKQQGFRRSDVSSRVRILTEALRRTCMDMDGVDTLPWSESLGRNISHAAGPLVTLNRLGILTTKKRHVHSRLVQVGCDEGRWLCAGVLAITQAHAKVSRWVRLSDACQVTAPRTCKGWVSEYIRVNQIFQDHRMYEDKSYMRNFVIRGAMLAAMARAKVPRLRGAGDIDTMVFASAFPDQRGWLHTLSREGVRDTLPEFMAGLGYDGRPEMLTMFLCLLLTKTLRVNPAWLLVHRTRLCSAMCLQHGRQGLFRLPALCVQDASC